MKVHTAEMNISIFAHNVCVKTIGGIYPGDVNIYIFSQSVYTHTTHTQTYTHTNTHTHTHTQYISLDN